MGSRIARLIPEDAGASTAEYAVMIAVVAALVVAAAGMLGPAVQVKMQSTAGAVAKAGASGS